ncbi:UNVERIFIED_CONTAM: Transcription factor [Sesamum radiatum]|uniref:Transcription factor n=1 Tax=Sesamum radiatum TaxID=300843 RepID=A0AAW2NCD8_SESRA
MDVNGDAGCGDKIKGSWNPQEDAALIKLVEEHGPRNWSLISSAIPGRSGKSCRLRWCNQLSPTVQHAPSRPRGRPHSAHALHGNRWAIARILLAGLNAIKIHHQKKGLSQAQRLERPGGEFQRSGSGERSSDESGSGRRSGLKRQCSRVSMEQSSYSGDENLACGEMGWGLCGSSDGLTLTLLPPGRESVKSPAGERKETVEIGDTCLMTIMQRMVAQEVRNYFDKLRAQGGLGLDHGPGFESQIQKAP